MSRRPPLAFGLGVEIDTLHAMPPGDPFRAGAATVE